MREVEEEEREKEREREEEEQRERERQRLERERERAREREWVLPKISVGPSLTPPETALATPLSPLFEGAYVLCVCGSGLRSCIWTARLGCLGSGGA